MLTKIKATQWGLGDVDWDAPGRERITAEQWPKLKTFMADLMWIEHVGARGFAAMAKTAPTDTLREIYTYFHAEEQRHANAEMALMKRWGMLDGDALPEPNINLRLVIEWLDKYADEMPFYVLGAVIPMLEIALDGALCRFLLDTVDDPICHAAFDRINGDEARHLAVGFTVMEQQGVGKNAMQLMRMCAPMVDPRLLLGIAVYVPLNNQPVAATSSVIGLLTLGAVTVWVVVARRRDGSAVTATVGRRRASVARNRRLRSSSRRNTSPSPSAHALPSGVRRMWPGRSRMNNWRDRTRSSWRT